MSQNSLSKVPSSPIPAPAAPPGVIHPEPPPSPPGEAELRAAERAAVRRVRELLWRSRRADWIRRLGSALRAVCQGLAPVRARREVAPGQAPVELADSRSRLVSGGLR